METKIINIQPITPSVTSFHLEKPPGFDYQAGQYINITIPCENPDNRGSRRNCSLSSAPYEDVLTLSFRHGVSTFKKTMLTLGVGTPLSFIGPFGTFFLNEDTSIPAVFLVGGIGITPVHSMIKQALFQKLPKQMTVIYSNRNSSDVPFKEELDTLAQHNTNLTIHYTTTQDKDAGRHGRIDQTMIREIVPDISAAEFYMCGVPKMTLDLKKILEEMGVTKDRIYFEVFTGY